MQTIEQIVNLLLIPILPALAVLLGLMIKKHTEKIAAELGLAEDSMIALRLNEATIAVTEAIQFTAQTYVDAMKDRNAFDEIAQKAAVEMATAKAKLLMDAAVQTTITNVAGDLDAWIQTIIEAQINEMATTKLEQCEE